MNEAVALRFENPFEAHVLCVKPFLDQVSTLRSLPTVIREFRRFDAREVSPRVRPERRALHRVATHPLTLYVLGADEVLVQNTGLHRHTIDTLNNANSAIKFWRRNASRKVREALVVLGGSCDDPYGDHPQVEHHTSKQNGKWQIDYTTERRGDIFSSCE